jgi:4-amino-4-deoxy-L-arabinose transferase-like glycosyltransferase
MAPLEAITKRRGFSYFFIFFILACYFWFVSRHRLINGDEGYYLLASRLVLEGRVPYLDFFYPQAPLLPYVYGLWMKIAGLSWFSARTLSALLTAVLGLLIYDHVCRETRNWIAGVAAIILFCSSTLIVASFPIVKTYSLSTFFLFASYSAIARLSREELPSWLLVIAGILFGLSVDTRLYMAGVTPIFLWWIFYHSKARNSNVSNSVFAFLGGFAVGLAPCLILFIAFPEGFLFDNLGYHAIRSGAGLIGDWKQKLNIVLSVTFYHQDNGVQFTFLSIVSFFSVVMSRKRASVPLLAFLIALVIGAISLLPTPSFDEYFCVCMPFLIVAAVCGITEYVVSLHTRPPTRIIALAVIVVLAAFAASSAPSLRRYLFRGGINGVWNVADAPNWTLTGVSAVSHAIDQLAAPNERVASFWPGYIFSSKAEPYPRFENDFGWLITTKLTPDQRAKFKIGALADIDAAFSAHTPRIVVVGNNENGGLSSTSEYVKALQADGYTAARTIGATSIFMYSAPNPQPR